MRCAVCSRDWALPGGLWRRRPPCWHAGRVHSLPQEDIPSSSARDVSAAYAAQPPSRTAVLAQLNAQTGATGYPADAPAIAVLSMLLVQPPFTSKSELPGRKRVRVEFMAATWEVDVETQAGEQTPPPLRILFPCAITMASGVQLKEAQQVVAMFAYRLQGGHWKIETAVRGRLRDNWFGTGFCRSPG